MRVTPLIASTFRSDGGSMFGLVPKPIWAKRIAPDERNRIPQHAHSLYVELDDGRRGFIDTGCGSAERFSEKEVALHGLGPGWPLAEWMEARGLSPDAIDFVVCTHLHWDHAGGALAPAAWNRPLTFPNARHHVHALEWEDAVSGNPLLYKSYPPEIVAAWKRARLDLVTDDDVAIYPGVRVIRTSGHTRGHAAILLEHPRLQLVHPKAETCSTVTRLLFAGDVCPMRHSLRLVFQTAYDTFPLDTRAWKRAWLPRVAKDGTMLLFDHDPDLYGGLIQPDEHEEFVVATPLPC